ncbi:MAG: alpha/beta hydrolase-fold protein [Pseudomonadota bacterium]
MNSADASSRMPGFSAFLPASQTTDRTGRRSLLAGLASVPALAMAGRAVGQVYTAPPDLASPVILNQSSSFALRSHAGLDYRIFVSVPSGPAPQGGFPVLYVTDGNAYFAAAAEVLRLQLLYSAGSFVQPMVVVGIGYPGEQPLDNKRRGVDLVHVAAGAGSPEWARYKAASGGADAFLDFLVDELRPVLAARYTLDAGRQSLAGHSLGGLFTLHALSRRPMAFQSFAAISPSIWVDEAGLSAAIDAMGARLPGEAAISVLQMVADDEVPGQPARSAMMLSTARSMNQRLQGLRPRGIRARMAELPGENHMSSFFCALPAILRQASVSPAA